MMASSLLKANTKQTLSRFRALFVALVIGATLLVASATVVGGSVSADARELDQGSGLTTLELLSVAPSGTPRPLTQRAVETVSKLPGVELAIGSSSVGTSLSYLKGGSADAQTATADAMGGVFWAMPRFAWSQPPVKASAEGRSGESELRAGEALLPDSYLGSDLTSLIGAELSMEYTQATGKSEGIAATMTITVVGVYDATSPRRDGDSAVYLAEPTFQKLFASLLGAPQASLPSSAVFTSCLVKAQSVAEANRLAQVLTDQGFYVNSGGTEQSLPHVLGLLQQVNTGLAVLLALFGLGVGMTMAGTWSQLRRWDVGVLTSLGWSPGRILRTYGAELLAVGLLVGGTAALLGTLVSLVGSWAARGRTFMGLEFHGAAVWPPAVWLGGVVLGAPLALLLGAVVRIYRLSRIEPDDALRRLD